MLDLAKLPRYQALSDIVFMLAVLLLCTAIGEILSPYCHRVNIAMVYLLGVILVAAKRRSIVAILMPALSVTAFCMIFVPRDAILMPTGSEYLITLIVTLVVALLISGMANRIRNQEQAAKAVEVAYETERFRNLLLSSVSHDLRTPLSAIAGAASSLTESQLSADVRQDLAASIYNESKRLNRLLTNLMDMTRLESRSVTINKQWQSIEEILGSALSQLESQLTGREVHIELPNLPLVSIDDILIEQVFINLLDNAAKYAPDNMEIRIWAEAQKDQIVTAIDTLGIHLLPDEPERLFGKFYRGTNSGAVHGTGLGLAVCKAIVEAHGGRMWAEQLPDCISFRFTLPAGTSPSVPAEETEADA